MDKKIKQLKEELITCYTNACMDALNANGIRSIDGVRFFEKLHELIETSISVGDLGI